MDHKFCWPTGSAYKQTDHAPADSPVAGDWIRVNWIDAYYNLKGSMQWHTGEDLVIQGQNCKGKPVYSIADGTVRTSKDFTGQTWRNTINVDHVLADGCHVTSRYAHLDSRLVNAGDIVAAGQQIGTVGDAFGALAPHLHFDVCDTDILDRIPDHWPGANKAGVDANYIDPLQFLTVHYAQAVEPPQVQPVTMYVTEDGLRLRSGPGTTFKILALLAKDTAVVVDANNVQNKFIRLVSGAGWLAMQYLTLTAPQPPETAIKLGVGIHYMATGPDREIIALAKTLADQGKAFFIKLCKSRAFSDALQVEQIKKANEECIVVLRPEPDWENAYPQYKQWNLPNLRLSGREFAQIYIDNFITNVPDNRLADYHEINCEPAYGPGTPSFWQGVMDTFEANNLKATVGNWSVFHPPLPDEHDNSGLRPWDTFWTWPETIDMVRRIKAGGHCLGFDEYIYPDPNGSWLATECMFRHDSVVKLLPPDLQDVTIYILEFGTVESSILSDDQLLAAWQAWDRANVHALGAAAWSFGLQGNNTSPALLSGRVALMQRYLLAR